MELVLFELNGGRYAFPAGGISKVLEALAVTPLPYAPQAVEGLVNVGGVVMVKMDLAALLGMTSKPASTGDLLIVNGRHESVVVQVDRVMNKLTLNDDDIHLHDADADSGSLVRGEFLFDGSLALLLDETRLGLKDVVPQGVPEGGGGLLGHLAPLEGEVIAHRVPDVPVLAVRDGSETYAFHMHDVQEIVELSVLTELPGVDPAVDGLMQLRGDALMVLSLARLLGQRSSTPARHVIVVSVGELRFGISVSEIVGMESHPGERLQALAVGDSQLEGYLPGAGDRNERMTGLLSLSGLLSSTLMESCSRYLTRSDSSALLLQQEPERVRRLLSFRVGGERCALELALVDRVDEYTAGVPLPDGDQAFPGVLQIQGQVMAEVDLRRLLGRDAAAGSSLSRACIVARVGDASWALIADRVDGVIEIPESDITPIRSRQSDYLPEVAQLDGELLSLLTLAPLAEKVN